MCCNMQYDKSEFVTCDQLREGANVGHVPLLPISSLGQSSTGRPELQNDKTD